MNDKLIVALDLPDFESAKNMVENLGDEVGFYKIGLEMMASGDYFKMIDFLKSKNKKIFADLKFYDIANTVARAVANLAKCEVDLLTIHAANSEIMEAAAQNKGAMKILAVTVLTCLDRNDLTEMGFDSAFSVQDLVLRKTQMALEAKLDGVVSSAFECEVLRKKLGNDFLIVTPGIRLKNDENDDQKRVADAKFAIEAGASHLVVGRPITNAKNPREVALQFKEFF